VRSRSEHQSDIGASVSSSSNSIRKFQEGSNIFHCRRRRRRRSRRRRPWNVPACSWAAKRVLPSRETSEVSPRAPEVARRCRLPREGGEGTAQLLLSERGGGCCCCGGARRRRRHRFLKHRKEQPPSSSAQGREGEGEGEGEKGRELRGHCCSHQNCLGCSSTYAATIWQHMGDFCLELAVNAARALARSLDEQRADGGRSNIWRQRRGGGARGVTADD
jgi:hypothetical protein